MSAQPQEEGGPAGGGEGPRGGGGGYSPRTAEAVQRTADIMEEVVLDGGDTNVSPIGTFDNFESYLPRRRRYHMWMICPAVLVFIAAILIGVAIGLVLMDDDPEPEQPQLSKPRGSDLIRAPRPRPQPRARPPPRKPPSTTDLPGLAPGVREAPNLLTQPLGIEEPQDPLSQADPPQGSKPVQDPQAQGPAGNGSPTPPAPQAFTGVTLDPPINTGVD